MTPLRIREEQLARLAASRRDTLVEEMSRRLRREFPLQAGVLNETELRRRVGASLEAARRYGISTNAYLYRFVCVCACFGWDFAAKPDCQWMVEMLRDPDVTDPHSRFLRLYRECVRRLEIRLHNRELRERFAKNGVNAAGGAA